MGLAAWGVIVQMIVFFVGLLASYFKLQNMSNQNKIEIEKLQLELIEIENMKKDILYLKSSETMREKYQVEIIDKILQPSLNKMNEKMCDYIDIKLGVMTREIENIKAENLAFKADIKEIFKDFKEDNHQNFALLLQQLQK